MPDTSMVVSDVPRNVSGHDAAAGLQRESRGFSWKITAVIIWLTFSIALAIWWLIFGLTQVDRLSAIASEGSGFLAPRLAAELERQHRMLMSEGATLVLLLLGGGLALLYYIFTEIRRARRIQEFFAAFTHDLKTSLASLRLQAESLEEDLKDSGESRLTRRLVKDTIRLELQLENSLLLAAPDSEKRLLIEAIPLGSVFQTMRLHWPDLEINVEGDGMVAADRRALESILKNLFQNAVVHGRASKVTVDIHDEGAWVTAHIVDDGRGFKGSFENLGRMFERHSTTSGSGLGLYLAMRLAKQMRGEFRVLDTSPGFTVDLILPKAPLPESL